VKTYGVQVELKQVTLSKAIMEKTLQLLTDDQIYWTGLAINFVHVFLVEKQKSLDVQVAKADQCNSHAMLDGMNSNFLMDAIIFMISAIAMPCWMA
jgi:hypothetical protein